MRTLIKDFIVNDKSYLFDGSSFQLFEVTDQSEKEKYIQENDDAEADDFRLSKDTLDKVVFNVSNKCNLRCRYCYADGGSYGRSTCVMTKQTFDRILSQMYHDGIRCIRIVSFFGGEPLMNFELIQYAIHRIKELMNVRNIEIVTNGTYLTKEIAVFLKEHGVSLSISIDGPEEINDRLRGKGVYQRALQSLRMCQEMDYPNLCVSATYTKIHKESGYTYDDICNYFSELGVRSTVSSVISDDESLTLHNRTKKHELIADIQKSLYDILDGNIKTNVNPFVYRVLLSIIYHAKSFDFCDELDPKNAVTFDYNGDRYQCFRFWGDDRYSLKNGECNRELSERNSKENHIHCGKCWARHMCKICMAAVVQGQYDFPLDERTGFCAYEEIFHMVLENIILIVQQRRIEELGNNFSRHFLQYQ